MNKHPSISKSELVKNNQENCSVAKSRGGSRENAGRKETGRKFPIMIRISKEAKEFLASVQNKSEYIDNLLIEEIKKNNVK